MPRRTIATADDGATLTLVAMPATVAVFDFVGGPLDGGRVPIRLGLGGPVKRLALYHRASRAIYNLSGGGYEYDHSTPSAGEVRHCRCRACNGPAVSTEGHFWLCVAGCPSP